MKRIFLSLTAVLIVIAVVYGFWYSMMSKRVMQIKTTIAHHNQQFKAVTPNMVLKADDVVAAGFPFHSHVEVTQLSLSMVEGDETYLVRVPLVRVEETRKGVNVKMGADFEALYAKSGGAPEHYTAILSNAPGLVLTTPETADTPYTRFKLFLPPTMIMGMTLNGEHAGATFTMPPQNPLMDYPIPANVQRPLWMIVNIMREALVFKTRTQ